MEREEALRLLVEWLDDEMVRRFREAVAGPGVDWTPPPLFEDRPPLRVLQEVRDPAWPPPSPYLPPADPGYPGAIPLPEPDECVWLDVLALLVVGVALGVVVVWFVIPSIMRTI